MRKYLLSTALLVCGTLFALPFSQTKECSSPQGWDEISQNWKTNQFDSNFKYSTFFLGTGSFAGTGTGAIPDGSGVPTTCGSNGANLDVAFNVTGLTGNVLEVSVDVTMTHTWIADVTATLIAPDGTTSLVLFGRTGTVTAAACGDSSNLGGTYLFTDDATGTNWWAAAAAIGDGVAMTAGSYRTTAIGPQTAANFSPETSLNTTFSTLADANGTWILRFTDGGVGDTGSVSAANLHIETEETEEPGGPIEECNDADVAILNNTAVTSVINIAESGTIGTDANLDAAIVDITHTWATDLEIVLISPAGTEVALTTDNGPGNVMDAILTFTDTSVNNVTSWTAGAPAADYRAEGGATAHPVAAGNGPGVNMNDVFAGESITGNWTLRVYDDAAGDVGTLRAFCLNFTVEEEPGGPIEECNDADVAILNNTAVTSVINIAESGTIGTDANLDAAIVDITHTWATDLEIVLISPAGTEVALTTDNGPGNVVDAILTFTDTSVNNVTSWTAGAPAADYRAEGGATAHPVAAGNGPSVNMNDVFAGESITGNWTLRVYDDAAGDVGTLRAFCLNFTIDGGSGGECEWTVTVSGSGFGDEVSWEFRDADGAVILSGGDYGLGYNDIQTAMASDPVEFYIESFGDWGDNTPFYSIANENGVVLSGVLAGGTESTFSDILCSDMPPPAAENDNCGDVTPTELTTGVTTTFTGTTVGGTASPEETAVLGGAAVWEAVTLTAECSNLTVDFCGTPAGNMDTAFVVYTPDCPVTTFELGAYDFTTCGDGNVTYRFTNLPAGTYYLPVLSDASLNTLGDYTMNVIAEECFVVEPPAYDCYQGDGMSSNGFEDGNNVTAGGNFRNADDFVVDGTFNLQYIRMNLFMNPGATAGSTTFNVRADESGMPSESNIVTTFTATPTSQVVIGSNFGLNVSQVEYVLTSPVDMVAGTYWLQPEVSVSAGPAYWEVTSTGTLGGFIHGSEAGGAWAPNTGFQAVFFVAGVCEELPDGCFVTGQFDQWPSTTFTPSCSGIVEVITATAWAGEYSKVEVTAGTEYIFSSSVTTDFITIADEDEEIAFATGTGSVTWTSPIDQVIRFYTHADEDCTIEEVSRSRAVQCGEVPPPPANDDCEDAIALSCGDSDSGSTLGANNSGGNLAGDVFYSFTGTGTPEVVTVSLCASSYDTFLRVFSDCTLSNEVAFNDDFCGLQSQLSFISDGTSTYVIMVEGYDVNVGDYVIDVTCSEVPPPPASCEDNEVLDNALENGYFFTNSLAVDIPVGDEGYTVEGAYVTVVGPATSINFTFYSDNAGMPGTQVATATGTIIGSEIIGQNFGFDFINYNVDFDAGVALDANTTYWMQVQSDAQAWDWTSDMSSMIGQPGMIDNGSGWASADGGEFVYQIYCTEMGIGDMNSFDFSYYPNPVKDFLNIESKKAVQSIDAFNLAGQKVMSDMKLTQGKLNISNLSPGTYVLRATLEGGQVETFKVIKK